MDIDEIVKRLEDGLIVADRIQERHSAALESHKQRLEDLTRGGMEHQRWMERHELTMQAIDERLEQITVKLDSIAELSSKTALQTATNRDDPRTGVQADSGKTSRSICFLSASSATAKSYFD